MFNPTEMKSNLASGGGYNTEFKVSIPRIANNDKWADHLSENRLKILKNIYKNSRISKRELELIFGLSGFTIDKNIHFFGKFRTIRT